VTLTFDLLTLEVVSESCVTWDTSVPILVFLDLSVLDLGPMYLTDRQTDRRQTASSLIRGGGIITTEAYWFLQTERIREFIHCTDCYLSHRRRRQRLAADDL